MKIGFRSLAAASVSFALLAGGCGTTAHFVWFRDLPPPVPPGATPYVIDSGDVLDVRVYNEERLSGKNRVREDGNITMPLIGDVPARGRTPAVLGRDLEQRLQKFLQTPTVTISVDEVHSLTVTAVGEVTHPGVLSLSTSAGVLQAIASAGGFSEFADRDAIYVLRKNPPMRIRFTYEALTSTDPKAAGFLLENGDVVLVE